MWTAFIVITVSCFSFTTSINVCEPEFYVSSTKQTRFQAQQQCKQRGFKLINFDDQNDIKRILPILNEFGERDLYYWMDGINYWRHNQSKWWFDNTGKSMSVQNWCTDKGQPQEKDGHPTYIESCVALNFRGDSTCWHDFPCLTPLPFICFKSCFISHAPVSFGEFCFFNAEPKTAVEAEQECQRRSYHKSLLVMNTRLKYARVWHHLVNFGGGGSYYWTSLKRQAKGSNQWLWNSGKGPAVTWTNWPPGQPNDPNSECVALKRTKDTLDFDDRPCYEKYSYICE